MTLPLVWIIIVNWNNVSDLRECIDSLNKMKYPNYKILVVDNGSSDESKNFLKEQDSISVILLESNEGFVGGNNIGIDYALKNFADFLLLLNNDTLVDPFFLQNLISEIEKDDSYGIAGPLICYESERNKIWSAGGKIDLSRGETSMIGIGRSVEEFSILSPYPVDFITGCAFLVKRSVIEKIGLLDSKFFAYYEETEFCFRAKKAGWEIIVVPSSRIWHKISPEVRASSKTVHYYMVRNRLLFIRLADLGFLTYIRALCEDFRTFVSWNIKPKWKDKRKLIPVHFQAIVDNFLNHWGKKSFE